MVMMLGRQKYTQEHHKYLSQVSEVDLATVKIKSNKSPGIDQIPAELIKAGDRTIYAEIHKLINSIWNKEYINKIPSCVLRAECRMKSQYED